MSNNILYLIENKDAAVAAPSAETSGVLWDKRADTALLVIKDRAGSGTMTLTGKLWGLIRVKNNQAGVITCLAAASMVDGETVTIPTAKSTKVFEFNKTGGITAGRVLVDISAATTDGEVAAALLLAINSERSDLFNVVATARAGASDHILDVILTDRMGAETQGTILEGVTDAGFTVSGFTGGYSYAWVPLGTNSTASLKGTINEASAMGETGTDHVVHCEHVYGLGLFDRIALETSSVTGTYDAFLIPRGHSGGRY